MEENQLTWKRSILDGSVNVLALQETISALACPIPSIWSSTLYGEPCVRLAQTKLLYGPRLAVRAALDRRLSTALLLEQN